MPVRVRPSVHRAHPECGTLCCRRRQMDALLHAVRSSFSSHARKKLRPASGRAGAAIGASRASRSPECGTLCCRQRQMDALLHAVRSSFSSHPRKKLRPASGRAGAAIGASRASRSPEIGAAALITVKSANPSIDLPILKALELIPRESRISRNSKSTNHSVHPNL
jgi:hypothetical protein